MGVELPVPHLSSERDETEKKTAEIITANISKIVQPKFSSRRLTYKRCESKDKKKSRKERLQLALEMRIKRLEAIKQANHEIGEKRRFEENKAENVLTRDLLLLSADRYGPFVGRPR